MKRRRRVRANNVASKSLVSKQERTLEMLAEAAHGGGGESFIVSVGGRTEDGGVKMVTWGVKKDRKERQKGSSS